LIFVVLGTSPFSFERLVTLADYYAQKTGEEVFIQTGNTKTAPKHCAWKDFMKKEEYLEKLVQADMVLAHAGTGITIDSFKHGKRLVFVPRLSRLKEHTDDHQSELARCLEEQGRAKIIREDTGGDEAVALIQSAKKEEFTAIASSAKHMLIRKLSEYISALECARR